MTFAMRFESAPPPWNPIQGIVQCDDYDPIVSIQGGGGWDRGRIQKCTYPSLGVSYTSGWQYVNDLRADLGTDCGIAVYVVDVSCTCRQGTEDDPVCDGPPCAAACNCPRANALPGGPSTVLPNDSHDRTLLHETGHLFRNGDEYPNDWTEPTTMSGYFSTPNANQVNGTTGYFNGAGEAQSCVMRGDTFAVCSYTRHTRGWRDIDADGIFDMHDTFPSVALTPPSGSVLPHMQFASLATVTSLSGAPSTALAVRGNYLYVGRDTSPPGVSVIDWTTNTEVDVVTTAGVPYDIVMHPTFGLAYVSEEAAGVEWLNVSDPPNTANLGTIGHAFTSARGMSIESTPTGPKLYVASFDRVSIFGANFSFIPPIFIVDMVTPASVDVSGRYASSQKAYVANSSGGDFQVFDLSDLGSPVLAGTLSGTGDTWSVYESSDLVVLGDRGGRVLIVDVSDPASPVLRKVHDGLGGLLGLAGAGQYAWVTDDVSKSPYGIELATPYSELEPVMVGGAGLLPLKGIAVSGSDIFVAGIVEESGGVPWSPPGP